MHQRLGAEYYSLSSATDYESLAENPLKLGQTSSADALRLIICRTEEVEIRNQRAITVVATGIVI